MEYITSHSKDTLTQAPLLATLLEQRERLSVTYDRLCIQLDLLQTSDVEAVAERLIEQYGDDDWQHEVAALLAHGRGALPDEYYDTLKELSALEEPIVRIDAELDQVAGEEMMAFVRQEAQGLLNRVGARWQSDRSYTDEHKSGIQQAIYDLRVIVEGSSQSYAMAEHYWYIVELSRELLDDLNVLNQPLTEGVSQNAYTMDELNYAHLLNKRYRTPYREVHPDAAYEKPLLPAHEWQVSVDNQQRTALRAYLHSLDVEKEVANLKITGIDRLPFHLDDAELRDFLCHIPAIAFEGINQLSFKSSDEAANENKTVNLGQSWVTKAQHSHDFAANSAEITVWLDPLQKTHDKDMLFLKEYARQLDEDTHADGMLVERIRGDLINNLKQQLLSDITHEFGHALHYTLPVSLLHDWDSVARNAAADEPVTDYVRHMQDINHGYYPQEDFAESFQLYLMDPEALAERAPERYVAMRALINSCRP